MTLYQKNVTVPKSTTKDSPQTAEITYSEDVLAEIQVFFPPPSGHLCHASCWYGEHQLMPSPDYDLASANGDTIKTKPAFESGLKKTTIRLKAYNEDTANPHTLMWRIKAYPAWRVYWKKTLQRLISKFESFMKWMGG